MRASGRKGALVGLTVVISFVVAGLAAPFAAYAQQGQVGGQPSSRPPMHRPSPRPDLPVRSNPQAPPMHPGERPHSAEGLRPVEPAAAKSEGAEEHEDETPKPINWVDLSNKDQPPYLAALINFAILAIIYVAFGKKPIADALSARRADVSKQIEEAQKIKHEAEARQKTYSAKLEDLGVELATTKANLAAAGAGEKARIVRDAEEKAARMQKDAEFLIEQERRQVAMNLQREAVAAALVGAEQLLQTKLTMADQERVAEEFLATLVPATTKSASGSPS